MLEICYMFAIEDYAGKTQESDIASHTKNILIK